MGDLVISGGTWVTTGELHRAAGGLRSLAARAEEWQRRAAYAAATDIRILAAGVPSGDGTAQLQFAADRLAGAAAECRELASALDQAAENYAAAEDCSDQAGRSVRALGGYELGLVAPLLLLSLGIPMAIGLVGQGLIGSRLPAVGRAQQRLREGVLARYRPLLSDARFVSWVRAAVSSADEAMLGAARLPPQLALTADERGHRWFGLPGSAREMIGVGNVFGALRETPVAVHQAGRFPAAAPTGYISLAARIPHGGPRSPQVRIEKYSAAADRPRWIVYVGGTIDTGFRAEEEPFDDTSNLQAIARRDAGSVRAVRKAMAAAGIERGDQVLSVGYSQGGIVATGIVAEGRYRSAALVTFGSPTAAVDVPPTVPDVAVEVTEDLIPALGGEPLTGARGSDRILVRRSAYGGGGPSAAELAAKALPAHDLSNYRATAAQMDDSSDRRLLSVRETIRDFTGGAAGTATLWRADRG